MNKHRMQAYMDLIGQLLGCSYGQEYVILQAHQELVDLGLLQGMGIVAEQMRTEGNESNAQWLENLAKQLAEAMGLIVDPNVAHGQTTQGSNQFLREIFQCIADHKKAEPVNQFLSANVARLNMDLLDAIPVVASDLLENISENQRAYIAAVIELFGNLIAKFPLGQPAINVELAIASYNQALKVRTRETMPVKWAVSMMNLASAYAERIHGDQAQNMETAIVTYEASLEIVTRETMPVEWATCMKNLAGTYAERIRGDRAQNIEQAIVLYHTSLEIMTRESMPFQWATAMDHLATTYRERIHGDRAQNIEQAIETYQAALEVMTRVAMPVEWSLCMNNLAIAYTVRIRGDRAQNIEQAIAAFKQALEISTRDAMPFKWAKAMNNLANAYKDRIRGERAQNIEQAIAAFKQALEVRTYETMPVKWAQSMANLASAYHDRIRGERTQNIEQAIAIYEQILEVRALEAMPFEWATAMNNLANAYSDRVCGDQAQNIEQAIATYKQALQVTTQKATPFEWAQSMMNLASAYRDRIRGDRTQNIEAAITAYKDALKVFQPELFPDECRRTARLLGNLCGNQQRWNEAETAYAKAIDANEILYKSALSRFSQEVELFETNNLFRQAAFAQARKGQLYAAVATLEQGRARGLSEAIERDRADLAALENTHPAVYCQYNRAAEAVRQLEIDERSLSSPKQDDLPVSETKLGKRAKGVRQGLQDAIASIRQCPGYENFLDKPDFNDVAAAMIPGQPIVYLAPTENGSLVLIVHQSLNASSVEVIPIWLDDFTETLLRELLDGKGDESHGWFEAYNQRRINRDSWFQAIDDITHQLWDMLMEPVVMQLEALQASQAVLIPTGYLSFLPLHAAWTEDSTTLTGRRYALDTITFSYTPNARSLEAAQAIKDKAQVRSLLAVNEPRPTKTISLPSSEHEVEMAIGYFQEHHHLLKHEQATREAVLAELSNYNVLHFSCHGYANFGTPLNSGLLMANDDVLSLRDFFNAALKDVRLAILSACETGLPGTKLPDEVVSLPTGLLQAGVAGVVASLWSVVDLSTMLLMSKFYEFWCDQKLPPGEALRQAQIWLRNSSEGEIAPLLGRRTRTPDKRPFEHPFYWAAVSYIGV
ncbi:hypothetical protein Lepto7375DRAFT_0014 [Leptolyngbya sp. PCC 7375]|nr:hypothetical protein Lepto7375DRAFT_0014 [Leptolyngbya sp. PCC 7375]